MKKIVLIIAAMLALTGPSCTRKMVDDTPLQAPKTLYLPRDNYPLDLSTGQSLLLEWEYSMGGDVRYQVIFDKENGDFSNPIFATLSDNSGFLPSATVPVDMLISIARLAGGQSGGKVTVRWTVRTFKGLEFVTGVQQGNPRHLLLTLPIDLPESVTLAGTAVEGGSRAMEHWLSVGESESSGPGLRSDSVFASYLQMSDGTLTLANETGRKFFLQADGKVALLESDMTPASPVAAGLVFLTVDFEELKWTATPISAVWFWNRPWDVDNANQSRMTYQGDGVWTVTVNPFKIALETHTGYDSRYHFRMDFDGASTDRIGPSKADVQVSEIGSDGFTNAYRYSDGIGNQWAYSWKTLENDDWDGGSVTVTLTMKGEPYSHTITLNN